MEFTAHTGSISVWAVILSKTLFDRMTEVKEAPKTNKSNSSAYKGTVEFDLCRKSKHLAQQDFLQLRFKTPGMGSFEFSFPWQKSRMLESCVLTVWRFFDTLNRPYWKHFRMGGVFYEENGENFRNSVAFDSNYWHGILSPGPSVLNRACDSFACGGKFRFSGRPAAEASGARWGNGLSCG